MCKLLFKLYKYIQEWIFKHYNSGYLYIGLTNFEWLILQYFEIFRSALEMLAFSSPIVNIFCKVLLQKPKVLQNITLF